MKKRDPFIRLSYFVAKFRWLAMIAGFFLAVSNAKIITVIAIMGPYFLIFAVLGFYCTKARCRSCGVNPFQDLFDKSKPSVKMSDFDSSGNAECPNCGELL
ncbi:hypothetical protein [Novosphingobium sp.]|uniref:hypothetical protein n=1 Tax=Novosphingobium sp. TaxID=1874826 RepID=UPI0031E15000